MPLEEYQAKRKFDATPEPSGSPLRQAQGVKRGGLKFVVQKHQASRLHYDFRLEFDGVLKSWAVPKGPSLNPEDKRLAMMVEDHPYDYRTFEGIIPKGNYGAGTVMVWDEGTYYPGYVDHSGKVVKTGKNRAEQDKEMRRQLHVGHLTFIMEGKKLLGEFALIKIKNSDDENAHSTSSGQAWLLLKKGDEHANTKHDITDDDRSAVTDRSLDEIADSADNTWQSNRSQGKGKSQTSNPDVESGKDVSLTSNQIKDLVLGTPKAPIPHDVKPMLATLTAKPFDRKEWLYEIKWDGYRAISEVEKDTVKLYSRNLQPFEQKFAPVAQALKNLGHDAVMDGEVVVVDDQGRSRFQLLQNYQKTGQGKLLYYVFDLPWLDGHDLKNQPLTQRKQILSQLVTSLNGSIIRYSDHIEQFGINFFKLAREQELEGIMAKNSQSPYRTERRSGDWLKVKTHQRQEAVVGGFTAPRGGRQNLGALVLGVYEDDKLVYIGHTGGGFDDKGLAAMKKRLEPQVRPTSPFSTSFKTNAPVKWVEPKVVVEVSFSEWTADGHMRQPILVGVREDKSPNEVRRELPKIVIPTEAEGPNQAGDTYTRKMSRQARHDTPSQSQSKGPTQPSKKGEDVKMAKPGDQEITIAGHKLKLTNPNKVYWPDDNFTKGDLINYYREMAELILPYLKNRPQSLNRHPNGITGPSFYQKDMPAGQVPAWAKTTKIYSESNETEINYLVCNDTATLIYMANLGCIEINPWNSRIQKIDNPDWLVMDLDPEDIGFDKVIETARVVHEVLERAGVASYPKTSGATGLHIYVPLGAKYDYEQAKEFAHVVALLVNQKLPEITSVERSPAKRQKRVYLDYLQNRHGQTLAAPYSVRPKPGATVSTPLKWEEVKAGLSPNDFTLKNIANRIDRVGDLWKPVIGKGIDMVKALKALS